MNALIKWGILGCGNVTERKSGPAYQKTEGFALQAVMRRDGSKAANYAKRHSVPRYYDNADDLINDTEVDAVYIATPPDSHTYYALRVAQAGKPCCIEKPMAPTYAECKEICDAFEAKKLPLFVAYYRRSLPRFQKVKEWLDKGLIGEPRYIRWVLTKAPSPVDISGVYNWRTDAKIAKGGYFDDLASHAIDLFIHLLGPVTTANGVVANQQGLYTAYDAVSGSWLHKNGVVGSAVCNFGSDSRQDCVEIQGSKGIIKFSVFDEKPVQLISPDNKESVSIENPENIQLYHVRSMWEHLLGNTNHPSTGATAAHTTWVLDNILGTL